jgi:SAM-dependent methyltransferase
MFDPKQSDFEAIRAWGLEQDPLRAIADFDPAQLEARWNNPTFREEYEAYYERRAAWIAGRTFDDYYKKAEKPIDRQRWEFLKARKAWYIPPVEWDRFGAAGVRRILDLGCGDGDTTQRVIDHVSRMRACEGRSGEPLEIHGLDLNASRVSNARTHVRVQDPGLSLRFDVRDVAGEGVPYPDAHFDYTLTTGVLEILEDDPFQRFLSELCRVTKRGVFIEDLAEEFPGGHPREDLDKHLSERGFRVVRSHMVLQEPFVQEGSLDPLRLWPALKVSVLFAERAAA